MPAQTSQAAHGKDGIAHPKTSMQSVKRILEQRQTHCIGGTRTRAYWQT
jgi:hypothetical protein